MNLEKKSYKDTLNLPQTPIQMRAGLAEMEPRWIQKWEKDAIYHRSAQNREDTFLLHDGPPYPNGNIHLGHALNKILKDFILRFKRMQGYAAPYRPGWDCHGLPIETQLQKELLKNKEKPLSTAEFRLRCKQYALDYVALQKQQFQRLGIWADWENPYLTLDPEYETAVIELFSKMVEEGYLYKGSRPIHWCMHCKTALAEAEIEYQNHKSTSIYFKFEFQLACRALAEILGLNSLPEAALLLQPAILVWTTTPWTLPANVAVAVHPEIEYVLVCSDTQLLVLAQSRLDAVMKLLKIENFQILGTFKGQKLLDQNLNHPWEKRISRLVLADYVSADDGTGCVHIAPGHGQEDYLVGKQYGLEVRMPVDDAGILTDEAGSFSGLKVWDANSKICERLESEGKLLKQILIEHSYPHCWRCHQPLIFRATAQWFVAMDQPGEKSGKTIRQMALDQIQQTDWIPDWGKNRIHSMMEKRPDWCISRQRSWGIPIPIFYSKKLKQPILEKIFFEKVKEVFRQNGSQAWFEKSVAEILGNDFKWEYGLEDLEKESNIMDVWMESGASFAAVLGLGRQADMYLEGSDQHRGWFHSSLLMSVAVQQKAPYKQVLTHGFTVDDQGRKMSKSLGNTVDPAKVIASGGADILRLWVASVDFKNDLALSESILTQIRDAYGKIRNTWRFLHSNLYDFKQPGKLLEIDAWALSRLSHLQSQVLAAYAEFDFHRVYHLVLDYMTVELSAFYLDIHKDNLYCNAADSVERRSTQTAFDAILRTTLKLLAPVLVFSTEEIWSHLSPHSIHLEKDFSIPESWKNDALELKYQKAFEIREQVNHALEILRKEKKIASSLDAYLELELPEDIKLESPEQFFLVSKVKITFGPALKIKAEAASGEKCERCWKYLELSDGLCERCEQVVKERRK